MNILSDDMQRLVQEQRLSFVATVDHQGAPNLAPISSVLVWDGDHLVLADLHAPGTAANLQQNAAIELNVVDWITRRGYRFKGTGRVLTTGELFNQIVARYRREGLVEGSQAIRSVVLIRVERAVPVQSPAYDTGIAEVQMSAWWYAYYHKLYQKRGLAPQEKGSTHTIVE